MLRQIEWGVQDGPIKKNAVLPVSTLDPSQMKMTFHFFPKSGILRKTSLTSEVVKYELKNSRVLVVCDVTNYANT